MPVQRAGAALVHSSARQEETACARPAAPAPDPEHDASEDDHPEPARGQFAVDPPGFAQVQVAVELGYPGAQRERAGAAVLDQLPADLRGVGVDEDRLGLGGPQRRVREEHPGGVLGLGGSPDRRDLKLRVSCPRCLHLLFQRQTRAVLGCGDAQLVLVDELLTWDRQRVEHSAQGCDQEERSYQQAGEEVQAQHQGPQRGPGTRARGFLRYALGHGFRWGGTGVRDAGGVSHVVSLGGGTPVWEHTGCPRGGGCRGGAGSPGPLGQGRTRRGGVGAMPASGTRWEASAGRRGPAGGPRRVTTCPSTR